MTAGPVPGFSARDIFDPKSFYNRLRSGFQPELKLRGLFYGFKRTARPGGNLPSPPARVASWCSLQMNPSVPSRHTSPTGFTSSAPTRSSSWPSRSSRRPIGRPRRRGAGRSS